MFQQSSNQIGQNKTCFSGKLTGIFGGCYTLLIFHDAILRHTIRRAKIEKKSLSVLSLPRITLLATGDKSPNRTKQPTPATIADIEDLPITHLRTCTLTSHRIRLIRVSRLKTAVFSLIYRLKPPINPGLPKRPLRRSHHHHWRPPNCNPDLSIHSIKRSKRKSSLALAHKISCYIFTYR